MARGWVVGRVGAVEILGGQPLRARLEGAEVPLAPALGYGGRLVLDVRGSRSRRSTFRDAVSRLPDSGALHTEGRRLVVSVPARLETVLLEAWLAPEAEGRKVRWVGLRRGRGWRVVPARSVAGRLRALNSGRPAGMDVAPSESGQPVPVIGTDGRERSGYVISERDFREAALAAVVHDADRRAEGRLPLEYGPRRDSPAVASPLWRLGRPRQAAGAVERSVVWPGLVSGREAVWQVRTTARTLEVSYLTRGAGTWRLRVREDGITWHPEAAGPSTAPVSGRLLTRAEGRALAALYCFWPFEAGARRWAIHGRRIWALATDPEETCWGADPCDGCGWHGLSPRLGWQVHVGGQSRHRTDGDPRWDLPEADDRGGADALICPGPQGPATLFIYASGEVQADGIFRRVVVVPESLDIFVDRP